ncbi:MAG: bifunctional diaminohydroxyphosphoribosylaminopyrimidine deaminase/5-amino-6-(5-phosphoribosylamino)uracil reductase RibD [Gammaproteobacteria bacterium]
MSSDPSRDDYFMAEALRLARIGLETTHPNPRVGCVIVREGAIVGRGAHRRIGGPHAEIEALAEAGSQARGATVYITLEPCAHVGRTPPCAPALVNAGVARVVFAVPDPNPAAAGGSRMLREAGIEVGQGPLSRTARELNRGFFKRHETGWPWVTVKLAASLDGRTALANGASRWITGQAARDDVRRLRARSSAVVTGSGTILKDNPLLSVRREPGSDVGEIREPLRVVLDSHASCPPEARVFHPTEESLLVTLAGSDTTGHEQLGIQVARVAAGAGGLALGEVLSLLGRRILNEVLIEAGPTLSGAWMREQLIDECWLYLAPRLLGSNAQPMVALTSPEALGLSPDWKIRDIRQVGEDLRLILRPADRKH